MDNSDNSPGLLRTGPTFVGGLLLGGLEDKVAIFASATKPHILKTIAPGTLVHASSAHTTKKLMIDINSRCRKNPGINLLADSTSSARPKL